MSVWGQDALRAWAAERGLSFEEQGLLPAATDFLRRGLGAGSHRADLLVSRSGRSTTTIGGFAKREERHTQSICRGRLPGGLDGLLAHHFHLGYETAGSDSGWTQIPHTVVLAYVAEGARVARDLKVRQGVFDASSFNPVEVSLSGDSMPPTLTPAHEAVDGWDWRTDPPEEPRVVRELARGVGDLLRAAPEDTIVEMRDGSLCVAAPNVIEDAATLDLLCELASAIADGARRAASLYPPLDPGAPIADEAAPPHVQWLVAKAAEVQWAEPPASVPAAVSVYAQRLSGHRRSTHWKTSLIALAGILVVGAIWVGIDIALAFAFDMKGEALIAAVLGVLLLPWAISRAVRAGGQAAKGDVEVRSRLTGLEAFAREYARTRGLRLEDRDEFRHRFASPVAGAPLKVMYGGLGEGVTGRLILWIARDERWQTQYWNLAVVPAQPAASAPAAAGYQVWRVGDALVIGEQVTNEGRSLQRLDALRAAAARLATPALVQ